MNRILLDTHVLIWANSTPDRLGSTARATLTDPVNSLVVSAVSVAEIAVKRSIGKLTMPMAISDLLTALDAEELPLTAAHAAEVERLPMLHRDPFDRLLAGQAAHERLTLLTADERLLAYPLDVKDARV